MCLMVVNQSGAGKFQPLGVLLLGLVSMLFSACSEVQNQRAVYALIDTSGVYKEQTEHLDQALRKLLNLLQPGESLGVARIDSRSFSEQDVIARMSFEIYPSVANSQKRVFLDQVTNYLQETKSTRYTDITGGVLQAIEFLNETGAGEKYILLFTDLKEKVRGNHINDFPISFSQAQVITIDVSEWQGRKRNVERYHKRLTSWSERVEQGGGQWRLVKDVTELEKILQ